MPSKRYLAIDVQHSQLKGGRLNISADTNVSAVRKARKASVHKLIERGNFEVLEALRERRIHISEVDRAVRDGKYEELTRRAKQKAGPMKEAVDRALHQIGQSRKPGTTLNYWVCGNALVEHFTAERAMDSITADELREFIHAPKIMGGPWSANTKRNLLPTLRKIWETAGANPELWNGIELARFRQTRVAFLQPAEWRTLIEANTKHPSAALLALACLAGLRIGEIAHLRPGHDIDMERRVVRVQPRAGAFPWEPKTERSVRDVRMGRVLETVLEYHLEHFAGAHYVMRLPGKDEPVRIHTLGDWTEQAMTRAGLVYGREEGYTTHTLRHTFASWLAQKDVHPKKIAMLMGDTEAMVSKTYSHLTSRDLDSAIDVIDTIAGGKSADESQQKPQHQIGKSHFNGRGA